jgi:uncharacterized 2Fe-2S/4Fe-4S cluster protein (DUF4445 family)
MHGAEPLLDRWVTTVDLAPPSLQNNTADADRLLEALRPWTKDLPLHADLDLLARLPELLRRSDYRVRATLFQDRGRFLLVAVRDPGSPHREMGLAVDLGTTRVTLRLVDLESGVVAGEETFDNPQIAIGADILTRIHHAARPGGLEQLQGLIVEGLNRATGRLCGRRGLDPDRIVLVSLAGNTAMTHLLLGLDPYRMIREPYIPVVNRPPVMRAAVLGLAVHPGARILVFPNVGSYFGGDLIAGILYSGLHRRSETAILVDVGTNAEVVLGNRDWLMACAGAAGPALEGGVTRFGMAAAEGVIDRVTLDPASGGLVWRTIGDAPPRGICGSGLIDLAAVLFRAGMIDVRGRLVPGRCAGRLRIVDEMAHLVLVPASVATGGQDLMISQADLDSLIRSKAAMYTILETLAGTMGLALADLPAFYVAGTFGVFIDPASAVTIGMLPDLPAGRFKPLGNSSLEGAAQVLTRPGVLAEIDRIRDGITYLELNVNPDFMNRFSAARFLPHTNRDLFPSVAPAAGATS